VLCHIYNNFPWYICCVTRITSITYICYVIRIVTYSREQNSWEADNRSADQETPHLFWSRLLGKIEGLFVCLLLLVLSDVKNRCSTTSDVTYWTSHIILSSHLRLDLPRCLFTSDYSFKKVMFCCPKLRDTDHSYLHFSTTIYTKPLSWLQFLLFTLLGHNTVNVSIHNYNP